MYEQVRHDAAPVALIMLAIGEKKIPFFPFVKLHRKR